MCISHFIKIPSMKKNQIVDINNSNSDLEEKDWNIKKMFRNKKEEREQEIELSLCF